MAGASCAMTGWCRRLVGLYENPNFPSRRWRDFPSASGPMCTYAGSTWSVTSRGVFRVLEDNARTPVGCLLRGGEPASDAADLSRTWWPASACGRWMITAATSAPGDERHRARRCGPSRRWFCFRRVSTTRPTSSTCSWPAKWACRWSAGRDLTVEDDRVWMRTTAGLKPVHTIYRRISDEYPGPDRFPTRQHAGRSRTDPARGGAAMSPSPTQWAPGVADDKAVYAYMPRIIQILPRRGSHPAKRGNPHLR